jgi:hypothetical protein
MKGNTMAENTEVVVNDTPIERDDRVRPQIANVERDLAYVEAMKAREAEAAAENEAANDVPLTEAPVDPVALENVVDEGATQYRSEPPIAVDAEVAEARHEEEAANAQAAGAEDDTEYTQTRKRDTKGDYKQARNATENDLEK